MATMAETQGKRTRRSFTDDYKTGAVRLVLDEGKTVAAAARDLGLTESSLRNWVEQARADRTKGRTGRTTEERAELASLRKDNRELRMERDILKNVWSAPPLQGSASSDGEAVCVNVSGLLVEPPAPGLDGIRAHRSS
jgi:transposase